VKEAKFSLWNKLIKITYFLKKEEEISQSATVKVNSESKGKNVNIFKYFYSLGIASFKFPNGETLCADWVQA
jgi:hypothetical protein